MYASWFLDTLKVNSLLLLLDSAPDGSNAWRFILPIVFGGISGALISALFNRYLERERGRLS